MVRDRLYAVRQDDLWGYVDLTGKMVIAPQFKQARSFRDGLAPAISDEGKWGYIGQAGHWLIEPQYDAADPFNEGTAKVLVKQKKGNTWQSVEKEIDMGGKFVD